MNLEAAMALFTVCPNKGKPISVPAGISVYCPILFWLKKEVSLTQETFSFIYRCVHMCVFVCAVCEHMFGLYMWVSRCVCTCAHMHVEAKGQSLVSSSITFEPYQHKFFHWTWVHWLGRLSSKLWGSSCLWLPPTPTLGGRCSPPGFLPRDLCSGPQACTAGTLSSEPLPQPQLASLDNYIFLG